MGRIPDRVLCPLLAGVLLISPRPASDHRQAACAADPPPGRVSLAVLGGTTDPDDSRPDQAPAVRPVSLQEPRARTPDSVASRVSSGAGRKTSRSLTTTSLGTSLLSERRRSRTRDEGILVSGREARFRATTDAGSLLGKSPSIRGISAQRRNPIITDPRVQGSRIGQLAASGSHWVPARLDLDTAVSKLDAQLISDVQVVKGPYSVLHGPGVSFIHFDLIPSPRSTGGTFTGGSTSLDYQTNGQQWYGRQSVSVAESDWGLRVGYGHRTGSDYRDGSGDLTPASYKSRDLDVSFGFDIDPDSTLEVVYLHQDQTDVELAGMATDLSLLLTDAVDVKYNSRAVTWADAIELEAWFNHIELKADNRRAGKRRLFPFYDDAPFGPIFIDTTGETLSMGGRAQATWETVSFGSVSGGLDFRQVVQEIDDEQSMPRSTSVNPGLFVEAVNQPFDPLTVTAGVRIDLAVNELIEDDADLPTVPFTLSQLLGTSNYDDSFWLWSAYVTGDLEVDSNWLLHAAAGHGQRPPSLTEFYALDLFMFVLQNGQNTVLGSPLVIPEKRTQIDLGVTYENDRFSARFNVFHAWIHDYLTYEKNGFFMQGGILEQTNLIYVNTDLATLAGLEFDALWDFNQYVSAFATLSFVRGTDHTRNGNFATAFLPVRIPGLPRGSIPDPGRVLPDEEPLPAIPPLESRLGVRCHANCGDVNWHIELSARIVDDQSRVASSVEELPTPGFTTWDLRSFAMLSEHVSVVAGVENFTDKSYQEHFDYRSDRGIKVRRPGINFYLGSEVTY